jgi:hypothetical protein
MFPWLTLKRPWWIPAWYSRLRKTSSQTTSFHGSKKIEILRRWEYDARQLQVAEEESMEGPQPVTVDAVLRALRAIGATADSERCAPKKQGGSS